MRSLSAFLLPPEPLPRDVSDETFHLNMLPIQKTCLLACQEIQQRATDSLRRIRKTTLKIEREQLYLNPNWSASGK